MSESARIRRYDQLKLKDFLGSIQRYPLVFKELSLILRTAYAKLHKALQYRIFQDTLTAFRLLPQMQTTGALAAAHLLFQSVGATTFPKKRKILAVAEYKNAMVAHERSRKPPQEEIAVDLPHDVLVHVFNLLDFQSLVSVGPVCWAWNVAANDERLWQRQYAAFFKDSYLTIKEKYNNEHVEDESCRPFWRKVFKEDYQGNNSSALIKSNRGFCTLCYTIVWLDNITCFNKHIQVDLDIIFPIAPSQVVQYLVDGIVTLTYRPPRRRLISTTQVGRTPLP